MDECPHYRSISLRGFEKFKSGLICCLYICYSKASRVASYARCGYRISHTMVPKLLRLNRTRAGRQEAGGQSRAWRKLESLTGEHKRPQQHWPDVIVDRRSVGRRLLRTSVVWLACYCSVVLSWPPKCGQNTHFISLFTVCSYAFRFSPFCLYESAGNLGLSAEGL